MRFLSPLAIFLSYVSSSSTYLVNYNNNAVPYKHNERSLGDFNDTARLMVQYQTVQRPAMVQTFSYVQPKGSAANAKPVVQSQSFSFAQPKPAANAKPGVQTQTFSYVQSIPASSSKTQVQTFSFAQPKPAANAKPGVQTQTFSYVQPATNAKPQTQTQTQIQTFSYSYPSVKEPVKKQPAPAPPKTSAPPPLKAGTVRFDANGIRDIIDEHNALRSKIAKGQFKDGKGKAKPAAQDMLKMVWDDKLSRTAQLVSDTCVFAHSKTPDVGENLYIVTSTRVFENLQEQGKKAIKSWNDEFYKYGWPGFGYGDQVGHATQNVWAKTKYVGCAISKCQNGKQVLVACHYSPRGNYMNQNAYTPGATCSQCPAGTKCEKATGMCA